MKRAARYLVASVWGLAMIVLSLVTSCGAIHTPTHALYPGTSPTQQALRAVCGNEGGLCVTVEQLAAIGVTPDVYWGQIRFKELGFAGLDTDGVIGLDKIAAALGLDLDMLRATKVRAGIVIIEGDKCALDPVACRAVIRHEFGHLRRGSSQIDADCYAAQTGTIEETAALIVLVETFNRPKRLAALKECSKR